MTAGAGVASSAGGCERSPIRREPFRFRHGATLWVAGLRCAGRRDLLRRPGTCLITAKLLAQIARSGNEFCRGMVANAAAGESFARIARQMAPGQPCPADGFHPQLHRCAEFFRAWVTSVLVLASAVFLAGRAAVQNLAIARPTRPLDVAIASNFFVSGTIFS